MRIAARRRSIPTPSRSSPAIDPRAHARGPFPCRGLTWGDRQFGEVRAALDKLDDGVSLKQLTATSASSARTPRASGAARMRAGRLKGHITSTDVGRDLEAAGLRRRHRGQERQLGFRSELAGRPDRRGAVGGRRAMCRWRSTRVRSSGLKPGAGRVLGLASLAELPRRLALDFSDLTDKGFAFDTVRGRFRPARRQRLHRRRAGQGPGGGNRPDWPRRLEKQGLRPNCGGDGQCQQHPAACRPSPPARSSAARCCCSRKCSNSR